MERVKTGISGLDEMLNGGIPKRRHIVVDGGPGCGKTSFAFEFLYRGASEFGENGLFVSLEETKEDLIENMKSTFPMFDKIEAVLESRKLEIVKPDDITLEKIAEVIEDRIINNNVKRIAMDSLTILRAASKDFDDYRSTLFEFLTLLRNLDCTSINTLESKSSTKEGIEFEIEHFIVDGVIRLYNLDRGERRIRALEILKMRGTDHSRELVPFKVSPSGLKVYVGERVF